MAYDEELAERLRAVLGGEPGLAEQRMFGGLAFLVRGHMAVAASSDGGLLLRCDPARQHELIAAPGVSPFVMRDRELSGWLRVDPTAIATDDDLARWVAHGVDYARALPPK